MHSYRYSYINLQIGSMKINFNEIQLLIFNDIVVITTGNHLNNVFEATQILPELPQFNNHSFNWAKDLFKPLDKDVDISYLPTRFKNYCLNYYA